MLKRTCTNWWINFFKDLIEQDIFDTSNKLHCECIKFCFYPLLKKDLITTMTTWNNHRIRPSPNVDVRIRPSGRPNILYFTPSLSDANIQDYKFSFDQLDLSNIILVEQNLHPLTNTKEGLELYNKILQNIDRI